jgi:Flp pilus assembly pilin Flp
VDGARGSTIVTRPSLLVGHLLSVLDVRRSRVRAERGASAIEWAIIAAIMLGIVISVVAVLVGALDD